MNMNITLTDQLFRQRDVADYTRKYVHPSEYQEVTLLSVPRNFSRGRRVIPSLAERGGGGNLSSLRQRGYYQFGMQRLGVWSGV
jgi:hypothetical protein